MNKAIPLALASFMFAASAQASTGTDTAADDCVNNNLNAFVDALAGMPGLMKVSISGLDKLKAKCETDTGTKLETMKGTGPFSKTVKGTDFTFK